MTTSEDTKSTNPTTNTPPNVTPPTKSSTNTTNNTNTNATTTTQPALVARPPLDVYKKITILRRPTDSVTYEDSEGKLQRIRDLGEAATTSAPTTSTPKKKLDIPTPRITNVESYNRDVLPNYNLPSSYVRFVSSSSSSSSSKERIDYNADEEDEEWLFGHERFGPRVVMRELMEGIVVERGEEKSEEKNTKDETSETKKQKKKQDGDDKDNDDNKKISSSDSEEEEEEENINISTLRSHPRLPISLFEAMLDILEKATAFETIITLSQAERLLVSKLPSLIHLFGTITPNTKASQKKKKKSSSSPETPSVKYVIEQTYTYWLNKRSRLRRPLLRHYWPTTSSNDTNPHMVFRPREKEKYKLRKKRQNDMDAFKKLKQLYKDFEVLRKILGLVKKRESVELGRLVVGCEVLRGRLYDALDTSGLTRLSCVKKRELEELCSVPKYFDTSALGGYGTGGNSKKKKRKRSSTGERSISPTNNSTAGGGRSRGATPPPDDTTANNTAATALTPLIAGQDHGLPAPLFLHPLPSRQTFVTSWENAVPFVSSYSEGHAVPTFRFRHRPRVGRGGRIVVDRFPCPGGGMGVGGHNNSQQPVNVFTAGDGLPRFAPKTSTNETNNNGEEEKKKERGGNNEESGPGPADRLTDLLPAPLDRVRISRRIEEICAEALSDEEDDVSVSGSGGRPMSSVASSTAVGGGYGGNAALSSGMGVGSGSSASVGGVAGSSVGGMDVDENDGDEVFVRVNDWLDTDEQVWGEERFVIGPV